LRELPMLTAMSGIPRVPPPINAVERAARVFLVFAAGVAVVLYIVFGWASN